MSDDIAIMVKGVYKDFKIAHERSATMKAHFVTILKGKKNRTIETQHALKDISFKIKKGEFFGIVGRNGSGKSTLLKMLAGIYQPTKGEINVRGKLVPFIELGVGFNPELTGKENVFLNGALLGFSEAEVAAFYDEVVAFAELEQFMDKKLKNYSSGMQVRLAFAMAIRADADILLIDEVLAVGDADFQRKCYEYFQRIKAKEVTVIFVTHDMGAIRQYCDRVVVIDKSRLLSIGDAEKAAKKYMQLFEKETPAEIKTEIQSERWGDKAAIYKNVQVNLVDEEKNILITATVSAKNAITDPTFGFMVANEAKQPILGTNSKIAQSRVKPIKPGEQFRISWKFPNIFNEGKYNIELVIMYQSVTRVADWWEKAAHFYVQNDKRTPYIVNPPSEFSYEAQS